MSDDVRSERRLASDAPLLDVRDLVVEYSPQRGGAAKRAVNGVDLVIHPGQTVGLVGESGSGKSTIGRAILGLTPATSGSLTFDGIDLRRATRRERRALAGALRVIFQDPYGSLNPARTIGRTLSEALRHAGLPRGEVAERTRRLVERVGLPADVLDRYPGQFSGGQRQRIAIARALVSGPRLVVCDEAVSALDLSVQAQILNLLGELQRESGLAYLFISHDLAVVRHLADHIVVLREGRVLEQGTAEAVYANPSHPFTRELLAAAPVPDPRHQRQRRLDRLPAVPGHTHPGVDA